MSEFDVLILAGGEGTRLWPLSRGNRPKQFLPLPYGKTLIEQAVERAYRLSHPDRVWIVTVESQLAETRRILPNFRSDRIIVEPMGRNSGPASAVGTFRIEAERGKSTTIFVCTADHYIPDTDKFLQTVNIGVREAEKGNRLITFGIKVRTPNPDFGYIESGKGKSVGGVKPVVRFVEKPSFSKAKAYMKSGKYFWNSGMFAWRSDFFHSELRKAAPAMASILSGIHWRSPSADLSDVYGKLKNISIDYALMEKSRSVGVVPSSFTWSDVGTWGAIFDAIQDSKTKNGCVGKGKVIGGKGNLVYAIEKTVVLFGADNLVVVDTPTATMVIPREKTNDLRRFLEHIC